MERPHLDCAQRPGGDGLQGGHLRGLHDRGAEARPEGVRVDSVQKQGGVGKQYKVKHKDDNRNKLSKVTIREKFVNKGEEKLSTEMKMKCTQE